MSTEREVLAGSFLTRDEVAQRLKVSTRTVDRYIEAGTLTATKLGGRLVRIPESELLKLTEQTPVVDHPPVDDGGLSSSPAA